MILPCCSIRGSDEANFKEKMKVKDFAKITRKAHLYVIRRPIWRRGIYLWMGILEVSEDSDSTSLIKSRLAALALGNEC